MTIFRGRRKSLFYKMLRTKINLRIRKIYPLLCLNLAYNKVGMRGQEKETAMREYRLTHRQCCKLADDHPDFWRALGESIERQQNARPKTPDDLRRMVLAKRAAREATGGKP